MFQALGDIRQKLVFIEQGLDLDKMTEALNNCLLSEEEVFKGRDYWVTLNDPFPAWQ